MTGNNLPLFYGLTACCMESREENQAIRPKMPFKGTFESLATGGELLASTVMPPLMPSPMKLKTNNVMVETIQIQVFNRAYVGILKTPQSSFLPIHALPL